LIYISFCLRKRLDTRHLQLFIFTVAWTARRCCCLQSEEVSIGSKIILGRNYPHGKTAIDRYFGIGFDMWSQDYNNANIAL